MMTDGQFSREANYETVMAAARVMLKNGIVTERDYRKIDTIMRRKYLPLIGCLQPVINPNKP